MASNGNIPASARRTILGVSLLKATANAVERLVAAAKKDGHTISIYLPVGGYRSRNTQSEMRNPKNAAKYNIDPKMSASLAPVGESPHGLGRAVDFKTDAAGRAWLQKHAHTYGFSWPLGKSDVNHWVHDGHTASDPISHAPTRTVKKGATANRRTGPGSKFPKSGTEMSSGDTGHFISYAHGPKSKGGEVEANDVWFQGEASGKWFWSGNFTSKSTTGLKDLTAKYADPVTEPAGTGTVTPVKPPVVVTPEPPVVVIPTNPKPLPPVMNPTAPEAIPGWFTKFLKAVAAFFSGYKG